MDVGEPFFPLCCEGGTKLSQDETKQSSAVQSNRCFLFTSSMWSWSLLPFSRCLKSLGAFEFPGEEENKYFQQRKRTGANEQLVLTDSDSDISPTVPRCRCRSPLAPADSPSSEFPPEDEDGNSEEGLSGRGR